MGQRLLGVFFAIYLSLCAGSYAQNTTPSAEPIKKSAEKTPPAVSRKKSPRIAKPVVTSSNEESRSSGGVIREVVVEGTKKIEKDAVLVRIKSKVGQSYRREQVSEDVQDIFKMGYFYDIEVRKENVSGGVKLIYKIVEKPSMAEIVFEGNSEIKEDDLRQASELKSYEILDQSKLRKAMDKISKLYEEKGFFLVRIQKKIDPIQAGETVKVRFIIEENEKVKVKRVAFIGNRQLKDGDLQKIMATKEEGFFSFFSGSGAFRQELFDRDTQALTYHYYNNGYIQAKVSKPQITVTPDKKAIYITFRVEEGDQFDVGEIDFSGDLLFTKEELKLAVRLESGKTFSYQTVQGDISSLQAKYGDLGYAYANIIPRMQIREKEKLVDLTYEIEKGNKVYFGDFTMVGNTKTRDKVIRREMRVKEGELYNETRRRESLANVKRLGYFDDVAFNQKAPPDQPDVMNLDVNVKERNTGSLQVGAGYSSFNGFVFNGQVQQSNLFGKGQKLGVSLDLSNRTSLFNLNFTEPYLLDTEWSVGGDLYRSRRRLIAYDEIREGGALRVGHPLAPYLYAYFRYKNEHTNLSLIEGEGDSDIYPVETANGRTSSGTVTIEYDRRNDRLAPSDGVYASTSLEYAGLGGERRFTKGFAVGRFYKELFWDVVFRNNLTYGFLSVPDGSAPPFNELFLLGGANTLRGYQWFSVGKKRYSSKLLRDVPFGGRQQAYYNGEFEFPLISEASIKGVLFYDIGYADDQLTLPDFRSNYGFGFRWFSPIGPLRFEWGFPIDRRKDESATNFEFAIGAPF